MKRYAALLLAVLLLLGSLAACKENAQPQVEATEAPAVATPTPEPTAAPTDTPAPTVAPSQLWAEFDESFFREYVSSDITTLHQMVKDPAACGIDMSAVEVSLGHYSREENEKWLVWCREKLAALTAIDRSGLTEQEQMAYDTVKEYLDGEIAGEAFYGYSEPLTAYVGIHVDIPLVFWMYELNTREDVETYLQLLADVPNFMNELLAYEQYRAETLGIFMTESALDDVLQDLTDILNEKDTIFLLGTFNEAVEKIEGLTADEIKEYEARNRELLVNEFHNAYQSLYDGLEAMRPQCRAPQGAAAAGMGEFFQYNMKNVCSDDGDLEETMNQLMEELSYTFLEYMAAYSEDADSQEFSVGDTQQNIDVLRSTLDPLLPEVPEVNVQYVTVPRALADMFSPAAYLVAAYDKWQDNTIILNQPEQDANILFTLAHEGYDGHLYQYVYHRSMEGLPRSQQLLEPTAYAEAWSQYSERLFAYNQLLFPGASGILHHQEGMYDTLLCAYCALVVNGYDMTQEAFIQYMQQLVNLDEDTLNQLYTISVNMPYYYLPYAYGYAKLRSFERAAQEKQGNDYDQKAFFKFYLDCGPSYFNLIEDRLNAWLEK
jgi:uncharacterized protein (DUF885 family)